MASVLSVNIGAAAAKAAPQASGNAQTVGQQSQIPSSQQVAHASQAAAEQGAVKIELAKEKSVQIPKRVEGPFDAEEEKEKSEITDDTEKMEAESPYSPHLGGMSIKA